MPTIYVDADACPVKNEVYRVAERLGFSVKVVANASMFVPQSESIELIVVGNAVDAADDWIVDHAGPNDIIIGDDIPLASRALKKGAYVLTPKGHEHTPGVNRQCASYARDHVSLARTRRDGRRSRAIPGKRPVAFFAAFGRRGAPRSTGLNSQP